ncbi:hypothetical protein BVRB_8g195100 [Beta vulgaris subsp. vulgaris]|nr:hypothetical protein BVRB_8g195100 [Beta vulgaris subsp. vulgaris]
MGFFLSAKSLFIVGNLIVIFLLGEFKIKPTSRKINVSGCKKVKKLRVKKLPEITVKEAVTVVEEAVTVVEEAVAVVEEAVVVVDAAEGQRGGGGEEEKVVVATTTTAEAKELIPVLSTEELNRRADDFIAMVNKQIRLEAVEM